MLGSIVTALLLAHSPVLRHSPVPPAILEPPGYSGNVGMPPQDTAFLAVGTTIRSAGYSNDHAGDSIIRHLTFHYTCDRTCHYEVLRQLKGEPPVKAKLVKTSGGWLANFAIRYHTCGQTPNGRWIYWPQRSTMLFRFGSGGHTLEARERDYSFTAECGYGASETDWTGSTNPAPVSTEALSVGQPD